jgi:hypothetical protein
VWRFYEREFFSTGERPAGWISVDCVPFFDILDGEFLVARKGRKGIYTHYHDEGLHSAVTRFDHWVASMVASAADRTLPKRRSPRKRFVAKESVADRFEVADVLSDVPRLLDDPSQPGAWSAIVKPTPTEELAGVFSLPSDPRPLSGIIRRGILRLHPQPGSEPPNWKRGDALRLESVAANASPSQGMLDQIAAHQKAAKVLLARVGRGELTREDLELGALLGDCQAQVALGQMPREAPCDATAEAVREWIEKIVAYGRQGMCEQVARMAADSACHELAWFRSKERGALVFRVCGDEYELADVEDYFADQPEALEVATAAFAVLSADDLVASTTAAVRLFLDPERGFIEPRDARTWIAGELRRSTRLR